MTVRLSILAGVIGLTIGCSSYSPSSPSGGTNVTGTPVSIVSRAASLTNTAYAPNPIAIAAGDQQRHGGTYLSGRRRILEFWNGCTGSDVQPYLPERWNIYVSLLDPPEHDRNSDRSLMVCGEGGVHAVVKGRPEGRPLPTLCEFLRFVR
jgi:hypothetical protein